MGFFALCDSLKRSRRVAIALLAAPVAEAVQWLMPTLGRSCSATDMVDNLTGTLTGLALGAAVASLARSQSVEHLTPERTS